MISQANNIQLMGRAHRVVYHLTCAISALLLSMVIFEMINEGMFYDGAVIPPIIESIPLALVIASILLKNSMLKHIVMIFCSITVIIFVIYVFYTFHIDYFDYGGIEILFNKNHIPSTILILSIALMFFINTLLSASFLFRLNRR